MLRIAIAVLAVMLLALSSTQSAGARGFEDLKWIEMSSPNFRIRSLLNEKRTRELLENLELFRIAVSRIANVQSQEAPIPTEIYAVRNIRDFRQFGIKGNPVGLFAAGMRRNIILIRDTRGMDENAVILHEYTHFLTANSGRFVLPMWYNEGIAEYLGSVRRSKGNFEVGHAPRGRLDDLRVGRWNRGEEHLDPSHYEKFGGYEWSMFYAQSWALVHYLQNRPERETSFGQDMGHYVNLLQQETGDIEAFEQAFGVAADQVFVKIERYLFKDCCRYFGFPVDRFLPQFEVKTRRPANTEMALGLAQAAYRLGERDNAEEWFTVALEDEQTRARAEAGIGDVLRIRDKDYDAAQARFEVAVDLAPEDPHVHLDLAEYWQERARQTDGPAERTDYVRRARRSFVTAWKLDDSSPETFAHYGRSYLIGGDEPATAVRMLEEAEYLLPSHPDIRLWLAEAYLRNSQTDAAAESAQAVLARSHRTGAQADTARDIIARAKGEPLSDEESADTE